jgi:hypothetical protein
LRPRSSEKRLSRREYIKYAGAGVVAVTLAGAACYEAGRLGILNRAPVADFEYVVLSSDCQPDFESSTSQRTLRYIRPNSEEEITFSSNCLSDHYSHVWYVDGEIAAEATDYSAKLSPGEHKIRHVIEEKGAVLRLVNRSTDPDSMLPPAVRDFLGILGELEYSWIVDAQNMSSDRDWSMWLPAGEHKVRLNASDKMKESYTERTLTIPDGQQALIDKSVTIDPADLSAYPDRTLRVQVKGIGYLTGVPQWGNEFPSGGEMREHLAVTRNELGCNGIRITGYNDDDVLRCAQIAIEKGFDSILLNPRYIDCDHQDTVKRLGEFAIKAEELRQQTDTIQLQVGNELCLDSLGIYNGETYAERATSGWIGVPETT